MRPTEMIFQFCSASLGCVLAGCTLVTGLPGSACCPAEDEPGVGENPPCVEGATCCANGTWACNEGDGSSTCDMICTSTPCDDTGQDCGADEYCELPVGVCGNADANGTCQPRPDGCIEIFQPVCGCDGQTYSNDCFARMAGASISSEGECGQACGGPLDVACPANEFCMQELGECLDPEATGVCTSRPDGCDGELDPVCGCDGQTYGNECVAWSSGVSAATAGSCE